MTLKQFLLVFFTVMSVFRLSAQEITSSDSVDYYVNDYLRYNTYSYSDQVHTILLHRHGWELSQPVILLNSEEKLQLSFDEFSTDAYYYMFSYIHCDATWEPSDIEAFEYIDGFHEEQIESYDFSYNTIQEYVHYQQIFPTENMRITKSGNYIIKVYPEDEPENILLTARFKVVDPRVQVEAIIKQATEIAYRNYRQEIDFLN